MHEWFRGTGVVITCIWIAAGVGGLLLIERLYVFVARSGVGGRPFIERLIRLTRAGKIDEAIKVCSNSRMILSDVALLILRTRTTNESDLQTVAAAAALSLVPRLRRRLTYFTVLGVVAILLGFIGLADAYRVVHETGLAATGPVLGRGFKGVEIGFGVAGALFIAQTMLSAQAEQAVERVEELTARLVNALIDRPDVRLGHR